MWQFIARRQIVAVLLIGTGGAPGWIEDGLDRRQPNTIAGQVAAPDSPAGFTGARASQLSVTRPNHLGEEGTRLAAEQMIAALRVEQGIRIDTEWRGSVLHARGSGFEGTLRVGTDQVEIRLRLGLLLSLLRGAIIREAEAYLDRYIGPPLAAR
jgi:putative polyhydroxyalkanoate system protein